MSVLELASRWRIDTLIPEARLRARRRRLAAMAGIALCVVAGVAVYESRGSDQSPIAASSPPAGARYTVTTLVVKAVDRDGSTHYIACESSVLMTNEPGGGCGGVPVTGYDFSRVPGLVSYPNGQWQTPRLRLVGKWTGHAFWVTRASPASHGSLYAADPNCAAHRSGPLVRPSGRAISEAYRREGGDGVWQSGPCGRTWYFKVAVADPRTLSWFRQKFGKTVIVQGSLRRAR